MYKMKRRNEKGAVDRPIKKSCQRVHAPEEISDLVVLRHSNGNVKYEVPWQLGHYVGQHGTTPSMLYNVLSKSALA